VFINCSTCFVGHTAHHQELKNCNCSLWFYVCGYRPLNSSRQPQTYVKPSIVHGLYLLDSLTWLLVILYKGLRCVSWEILLFCVLRVNFYLAYCQQWIILTQWNFSDKICRENKNALSIFSNFFFFFKNRAVYQIIWKNTIQPLNNGWKPDTYVKPEAAIIVFELLMMSGVSHKTCWAINKHWNNKF
jgi:hypothetical protein